MKLVVGLGNPGNLYNFTRHNVGFLALDFYAKVRNINFEPAEKYDAKFFHINDTFFIKPQTFYNDVGSSIARFKNFYKIKPEDILVICDDFNLVNFVYAKRVALAVTTDSNPLSPVSAPKLLNVFALARGTTLCAKKLVTPILYLVNSPRLNIRLYQLFSATSLARLINS